MALDESIMIAKESAFEVAVILKASQTAHVSAV